MAPAETVGALAWEGRGTMTRGRRLKKQLVDVPVQPRPQSLRSKRPSAH
jgi:hypothetical protein